MTVREQDPRPTEVPVSTQRSRRKSPQERLQEIFGESVRFKNFGNVLLQLRAAGFRCHSDTVIDIESPITAFCGLNGTGKSTLLQLAAVAYKPEEGLSDPYSIRDFIVASALDPRPFTPDAFVEYRFASRDIARRPRKDGDASTVVRTAERLLLYDSVRRRWNGYRGRPSRPVTFIGVAPYLPSAEQRNVISRYGSRVRVIDTQEAPERVRKATCEILAGSYEKILVHKINYPANATVSIDKLIRSVERSGVTYSEVHMGYGEARILYLVSALESIPEQSLVLVEEPETALHTSAALALGDYLVDVCLRRHHQIILSTHSDAILEKLPEKSRILLLRKPTGVETVTGVSMAVARSLLADGRIKTLHVLVEDECAQAILTEMIRQVDAEFLRTIRIQRAGAEREGGAANITRAMHVLEGQGLPLAAVLDGDQDAEPKQNIYKLPGKFAPEKELLSNRGVIDYVLNVYNVSVDDVIAGTEDHHQWLRRLAKRIERDENMLLGELARTYATSVASFAPALVEALKEASQS